MNAVSPLHDGSAYETLLVSKLEPRTSYEIQCVAIKYNILFSRRHLCLKSNDLYDWLTLHDFRNCVEGHPGRDTT